MTTNVYQIPQRMIENLESDLSTINSTLVNNVVHRTGDESIDGKKTFLDNYTYFNNSSTYIYASHFDNTSQQYDLSLRTCNAYLELYSEREGSKRNWVAFKTPVNVINSSKSGVSSDIDDDLIPTKGWVSNPDTSTNVVHRSGYETITGTKTFTNTIFLDSNSNIYWRDTSSSTFYGVAGPSASDAWYRYGVWDGSYYGPGISFSRSSVSINKGTNPQASEITLTIPTPSEDTTSSTQADTVGARNTKLQSYALDANVVHKSGIETITGNKTFDSNINFVNTSNNTNTYTLNIRAMASGQCCLLYENSDDDKSGMISFNPPSTGQTKTRIAVASNSLFLIPTPQTTPDSSEAVNVGYLNNKLTSWKNDNTSTVDVIVETYQNGTDWYRIWSDGWIEQGGYVSIASEGQVLTYNLEFSNLNYTITCSGATNRFGNVSFYDKTTSSAKCWTSDDDTFNAGDVSWYACGYGANL